MPRIDEINIGTNLPSRAYTPTNVSLFLYNAAVWNAHRIHYDEGYTVGIEQHPGVVIDGPLQGDWLTQVVLEWMGDDGRLLEFEYSNRRASYLGETLTAGGKITAIDTNYRQVTFEVFIKNARGEITTPGRAIVQLSA